MTSNNKLAVAQAKGSDLWEPTTEAELDEMEAQGIQQPVIQPHTLALDPPLAEGATVRCLPSTMTVSHAWCVHVHQLTHRTCFATPSEGAVALRPTSACVLHNLADLTKYMVDQQSSVICRPDLNFPICICVLLWISSAPAHWLLSLLGCQHDMLQCTSNVMATTSHCNTAKHLGSTGAFWHTAHVGTARLVNDGCCSPCLCVHLLVQAAA